MPFRNAPRLNTFDYLGPYRYFLTICTRNRGRVFVEPTGVDLVLAQFRRTAADEGFAVFAYCFMPDHLHALLEGTLSTSNFKEFVRLFKQCSSYQWKRTAGAKLW